MDQTADSSYSITSAMDPNITPPVRSGRKLRAWLRLGAALSIAAALATGIVDHVAAQSLPSVPQTFVAATDSASDQAAIQATITRANTEQAQALSTGDPSVMADTSTSQYLQELTQVNQDLSRSGVSGSALVNIAWGPVTINGNTASATTYETWTTTLNNGVTLQSRDENDYTLTLDNGTWRIASDSHPAATSTGQPSTATTPPVTSNAGNVSTSSNWAGYAATNGPYAAVSSTWTIPAYSASRSAGVSATWVGIGGVSSTDLIQAGTQEQTSGTGQTQYQAWIEMLPQASRTVPLSVHAGDSVSVSMAEQAANTWLISFKDNTTGQSYQQTVQYASSLSSAEWIQEAPSAARAGVLPLDNFGTVSFTDATAIKNGETLGMSAAGATSITMVGANRQALAVPSSVGNDGESFSVTRTNAAATSQFRIPTPTGRAITGP